MDRRFFLFGLASSTLSLMGGNSFFRNQNRYEMVFKLVPKQPTSKRFTSADEFLSHYGGDKKATRLNNLFLARGWIEKIEAHLGPGGHDVIMRKVYRSKFHKNLYSKLWSISSRGKSDESKKFFQIKLTT